MATRLLLLAALLSSSGSTDTAGATAAATTDDKAQHHLTRLDLSKILYTAIDDDSTLQHVDHANRALSNGDSVEEHDNVWNSLIQHGWEWNKRHHSIRNQKKDTSNRRNLRSDSSSSSSSTSSTTSPNTSYILCSTTPNSTGYQRRTYISKSLSIPITHIQTVYNTIDQSCFTVTSNVVAMESYIQNQQLEEQLVQNTFNEEKEQAIENSASIPSSSSSIKVSPLVDIIKLPRGTISNIQSDPNWNPLNLVTNPLQLQALTRTVTNEFSYENVTEEVDVDVRKWKRSIMIELSPDLAGGDDASLDEVAKEIVQYVKDMAQIPPSSSTANEALPSSYLRSSNILDGTNDTSSTTRITEEIMSISTREAFSLTATTSSRYSLDSGNIDGNEEDDTEQPPKMKRVFHNKHNIWSTALSKGFEAEHGCQVMLDTLEVRTTEPQVASGVGSGKASSTNEDSNSETDQAIQEEEDTAQPSSIEIILHPPSQYLKTAAVESSAWNTNCVISLLMGLSIHPDVQTVEVGVPIELASLDMYSNDVGGDLLVEDESSEDKTDRTMPDIIQNTNSGPVQGVTNPQWIIQSGQHNSRPFFDVGLDGTGQTVAVADGGLDIDNCYFRDRQSSINIYGEHPSSSWDYTQRKVVHYDDTFGDRTERSQGHGTLVSAIISGKRSANGQDEDGPGHADGTAPGSKLAFYDMELGYQGIDDPGVEPILKSLYNPNGDKGARVINASWGRSYKGQYTSYCRKYDFLLRNVYQDLLFIVSAGNTGRAGKSSIQDPADCKNPMAVGSTLSYGSDLRQGELGHEYLADYSSRGPAQDGRMKPDIVGPGHFVLTANAVPNKVGECDGDYEPDVKLNRAGGKGVKYTTGTSMASPALAGGAAIIRQYFEDRYCNTEVCCGYKGCTGASSMNISGSLLKAILMNGAQFLKGGVQYVPSGQVFADQPLAEYDNNQGYGRMNLLNSVPLAGRNNFGMKVVNEKYILNGNRDSYQLMIDKSNGCDRDLRVTLAWYDAPASIGCTNCVMNDLDLSIKTSTKTLYPNGRNSRDTKNTVERIITNPSHGEEVRIIVDATNFATATQQYSLAIAGCFSDGKASRSTDVDLQPPPLVPVPPTPTPPASDTSSVLSCPGNRRFEMIINSQYGEQLSWSLLESLDDGNVRTLMSGSGNTGTNTYTSSSCLASSTRYRFQLRDKNGSNIQARYVLSYMDNTIFNTKWSDESLGRVSTYRFKTDQNGMYQQLGSNSFMPHIQTSEATEIGIRGDETTEVGYTIPLRNDSTDIEQHEVVQSIDHVLSVNYQELSLHSGRKYGTNSEEADYEDMSRLSSRTFVDGDDTADGDTST